MTDNVQISQNRKNDWYKAARMGLFIHWGINTGNPDWKLKKPLYRTVQEFEQAVNSGEWSAEKWIGAAKKLRAAYVTLAIFHSVLGYIRPWKTAIPGTASTQRDILGELLEEGEKQGVKVLVYISGDPGNHSFFSEYPWINSEEYARYKGDSTLDIKKTEVWQRVYCKDVIEELIDNYPQLGGFWFDGWNEDNIDIELFGFIHRKAPHMLTIRNNFLDAPLPDEDVMSLECFGKVYEPDFDFVSSTWVEPGGKECCYVMPELSDWWYYYPPKEYDKGALIKKMVTICANGWVAKMGLGPEIGGDFPGIISNFIDDVSHFYSWAEESIMGTQPGGLPQCRFNGGAYVVTTCRPDEAIYYLHVLMPPKGDILIIPDGGIDFKKARGLRDGNIVDFEQKGGQLFIKADFTRICNEEGDTVIKLESSGVRYSDAYLVKNYLEELPVCAEIAMNSKTLISGLIIEEDETSAVTRGGWAAPDNNRLKEYSISASEDGVYYKDIQRGRLNGTRGIKQFNFEPVQARYARLCAISSQDMGCGYVKRFAPPYWKRLEYENVISYTVNKYGIEYFVNENFELALVNGGMHIIAENVSKVFTGGDNSLYCITTSGELMKDGLTTGISTDRAAVDADGMVWFVKDGSLYDGKGKRVAEGVNDVTVDSEGCIWYCGRGYISNIKAGKEEKWNVACNPLAIAVEKGVYILNEDKHVYGVGGNGANPYKICNNAHDISVDDGVLHVIESPLRGRLRVNRIRVIKC